MKSKILLLPITLAVYLFTETAFAQSPNWSWAKSAAGSDWEQANSIATDASGNIYVAGWFQSPIITFGSITLATHGVQDIFIAKYDKTGNVLWAQSFGGGGSDVAMSVTCDAANNVYL